MDWKAQQDCSHAEKRCRRDPHDQESNGQRSSSFAVSGSPAPRCSKLVDVLSFQSGAVNGMVGCDADPKRGENPGVIDAPDERSATAKAAETLGITIRARGPTYRGVNGVCGGLLGWGPGAHRENGDAAVSSVITVTDETKRLVMKTVLGM